MKKKIVFTPAKIKDIRESMNMDQQAFADYMDYSREHICRLEKGRLKPSKSVISKLIKINQK